jgi:hypothetical protein
MNTETVDAIKDALVPIAAKIGQGAEFGWSVVVKQQFVEGISYLVWAGPIALLAIVCWWFALKYAKETDGTSLFLIVPALILTIWAFTNIDEGVLHLLNPEYYALDFFIHLTK